MSTTAATGHHQQGSGGCDPIPMDPQPHLAQRLLASNPEAFPFQLPPHLDSLFLALGLAGLSAALAAP